MVAVDDHPDGVDYARNPSQQRQEQVHDEVRVERIAIDQDLWGTRRSMVEKGDVNAGASLALAGRAIYLPEDAGPGARAGEPKPYISCPQSTYVRK